MVSSSACKGLFLDILPAGLHGVSPTTWIGLGVCATSDVPGISSDVVVPRVCDTAEDML